MSTPATNGGRYSALTSDRAREQQMEYLIGLILSLAVAGSAAVIGFDRERAFYPTVLIVIASYYGIVRCDGSVSAHTDH